MGGTMKRTLTVVLAALALVLGAPAAQATTDGWCQDSADSCRAATPPATEGWCSDVTIQDVQHTISIEDQVLGQTPCA